MTQRNIFDGVDVLVPARIHRSRALLSDRLRAEISEVIEALQTTSPASASCVLDEADPEQFKTWALAVIRALPTHTTGEIEHGNS